MPNSDPASPPKPLTIEDILEVFEEGSDEAIAEICRIAHPGDIVGAVDFANPVDAHALQSF